MNYKKIANNLNKQLGMTELVMQTFGNASLINLERTKIFIKPSGVDYKSLNENKISVVDIKTGNLLEGLKPSVDLDIHLEIYKNLQTVNCIIHTHSKFATIFAQSKKEIPILGTTHADFFKQNIPITKELSTNEIKKNYELNIGKKIVEIFNKINHDDTPAALIANHGSVVFGKSSKECLENALILEHIAELAYFTSEIKITSKEKFLFEYHHNRKHGKGKYYGQ